MKKKTDFKMLLTLFAIFFKIGAFTFGGGYAMIPLIQKEVSENKKWITNEEILDVFAISESTPGPIAINSATFIGYKVAGFWGSFFATLGVVLPSFLIISLISLILDKFQNLKAVQYAFFGIRAGVLALIVKAFWSMAKVCPKKTISYVLAALSFIFAAILKVDVLIIIIACAIIGLVTSLITERRLSK